MKPVPGKNANKWAIQAGEVMEGRQPHCPNCGGSLDYEIRAKPDRRGYVLLSCAVCDEIIHFSAQIPDDVEAQPF